MNWTKKLSRRPGLRLLKLKLIMILALAVSLGSGCGSHHDEEKPSVILTLGNVVQYQTRNVGISKIATGDLNGDGLIDVAAIGSDVNGEDHILIYYQGANGTFTLVADMPVADRSLRGLAIGDVNNDGKNDLIVSAASRTDSTGFAGRLLIYYQDPATGTLKPPQELAVSSIDVGAVSIADLNSDGRKDIAVLGSPASGVNGNISIFYQKPDGSLGQEFVYNQSPVRLTGKIRAADMNNDGRNDLVFRSGDLEFTIIRQLSDGTLSTTPDVYALTTDLAPSFDAFAVGDANGDGKNDVVVAVPGTTGFFFIFLQNSAGKLDPPIQIDLLQNAPDSIVLADINGDGLNDIVGDVENSASSSNSGRSIRVYYQEADHSFNASNFNAFLYSSFVVSAVSGETSVLLPSLAIGDVTGDHLLDVVVGWSDQGLFVLPGMVQSTSANNLSISGTITSGGAPLVGVTVSLRGALNKTATTDSSGNYTFTSLVNGNYSVTPSKIGFAFSPATRSVTVNSSNVTGQDFIGANFSISGTITSDGVPLLGVAVSLSGTASKTTTTDASGNYAFIGISNGTYTVKPSKTGYTFSPANRSVAVNGASVTGQDFTGTTFSISGTVTSGGSPLAGVLMTLSGTASKATTTDSNGNYTFAIVGNGSYTVTPSKAGYNFSPTNRSVTINGASVTGQDFTGTTFSISGTVTSGGGPLAGVLMSLSGTAIKTTSTDASGNYTFNAVGNGNYTVTPSKAGYSFSPTNRSVTISGASITGQDFTGTTFSISGTVTSSGAPLAGVTISLSGAAIKTTTTDASGNYTFNAVGNGSYTVTPSKAGYSFSPTNRSVTISGASITGQDFTGTTFSISGTVTSSGAPLPGVTMFLSGAASKTTTTDASGNYTFNAVGNGSYTVTPSKVNYIFTPTNRSVTVSGASITGQDFTGTTFSISGTVTSSGAPLQGVTMTLSGAASKTITTDASGHYTFTIVGNGNYTVTPSKLNYVFTPTNRSVTVSGANVTGQDFTGTTFSISGTVTSGGSPLQAVTMTLSGAASKTTTTNASGVYTFTTLGNGNYTVTPFKTGVTFSPANRSVTISGANVTGANFTAN